MKRPELIQQLFVRGMAPEIYDDIDAAESELEIIPNTVIITPTHMGSSVFRDPDDPSLGFGDAGRKARGLAERSGYPVMAIDRPPVEVNPVTAPRVAQMIGRQIMEIIGQDFDKVILAGNSAGASFASELTAYGELPVTHLALMDPVGMGRHTVAGGFLKWLHYGAMIEPKIPAKYERTSDDRPEDATGFSISGFLRDSRMYQGSWKSDATLQRLWKHVSNNPGNKLAGVDVLASWPSRTYTTHQAEIRYLTQASHDAGRLFEPPLFRTEQTPGTADRDFENFRFYADCVGRLIKPDFAGFTY